MVQWTTATKYLSKSAIQKLKLQTRCNHIKIFNRDIKDILSDCQEINIISYTEYIHFLTILDAEYHKANHTKACNLHPHSS